MTTSSIVQNINSKVSTMQCIRIGYGSIARWHEKKLSSLGVATIGTIEQNSDRALLAQSHGFRVVSSYQTAANLNPCFWDICTPTVSHIEIVKQIIEVSPDACILVEKPICLFSQIEYLKSILKNFRGKLVVNENYRTSEVTKIVRDWVKKLCIKPTKIIAEMTKNRSPDILNGRFIDQENFVLGYEGPHMINNVVALSQDYTPIKPLNKIWDGMYVDDRTQKQYFHKQGKFQASYLSKKGTEVVFYTSMNGQIGFLFPHSPYSHHHIPSDDSHTRYRILAVEDRLRQLSVIGYYEPIIGWPRATGMVMVIENKKVKLSICPIQDDTLQLSMQYAVNYFKGISGNPCTWQEAIETVNILQVLRH